MKAIILLNEIKRHFGTEQVVIRTQINEAIKELECIQDVMLDKDEALAIERVLFRNKIKELQNRSCENCKYIKEDSNETDVWKDCKNKDSLMYQQSVATDTSESYPISNFSCNKWEKNNA